MFNFYMKYILKNKKKPHIYRLILSLINEKIKYKELIEIQEYYTSCLCKHTSGSKTVSRPNR